MSDLDLFAVDSDVVQQEERDSVGGFQPWESDVHDMTLTCAYMDASSKGSKCVVFLFQKGDKKFTHTEYVTNQEGKNYYVDKKTGEKKEMFGVARVKSIFRVLTGKEIAQARVEEKQVKIYDYDKKEDVAQPRKVFMDLVNVSAKVGIRQVEVNKQVKGNDGQYVPTAETRIVNELDKVFNAAGLTDLELKAGMTEPKFINDWLKANQGKVVNKVKKVEGGAAGAPQAQAGAPISFDD